jgi:metallo-beta-lactamase class B
MTGVFRGKKWLWAVVVGGSVVWSGVAQQAQPAGQRTGGGAPTHPSVTVEGESYTPASILARNMGSAAEQEMQFPPHKIIGNIYYVGTKTLSSFLIVTPAGNILLDSTYERNVPVILKSVEDLGFKFSDVKILLGNHAHGDHMEGDALVKMMTGAKLEAMAEDLPALQTMKPGGKEHTVDVVLHDGDTVSLGGVVLTAHLTAGHTRGCTTFTTVVKEGGKDYNVVFGCSLRAPTVITPEIAAEFRHSFEVVHALPCDVQLGDHPAQYGMIEKYEKLKASGGKGPNPFIDKVTCKKEIAVEEAMYHAILEEQEKAGK